MSDETLLCSIEDGVAIVTLNRPEKLNAITPELGRAYDECMVRLALDAGVRVIVITGAGRGFCGGADAGRLEDLSRTGGDTSATASTGSPLDTLTGAPLHLRQRYMLAAAAPKPVIAAVNGPCVGAGLGLAISCDIRFASEMAYFSAVFSRRGLTAESALAWTLPRLVGRGAAADILLSGRRIEATEALRIGLVNAVLTSDSLLDHALGYARDIAANVSPRSALAIKSQLRAAEDETLPEALASAAEALRQALASPDFREGVAAMRERRQARFPPL